MPLFQTPTARANVQPIKLQVTRNNFPYAMAFIQAEPQDHINMQPIQERGLRWLGNVDQLLERERARLALQFADGDIPAVTPGTGPLPTGTLPPGLTLNINAGGGQPSGQGNGQGGGGCK